MLSQVSGRAVLADGRPLAQADVLALPSDAPLDGTAIRPRPAHARTGEDGRFAFEADQGQYTLQIDPEAGTDFPRVVQLQSFGTGSNDVGDVVIPPPAVLAFVLRDPSAVGIPIARAVVRVFAELPDRGPPSVEIGSAISGTDGRVEILLAPRAR
jgi:hypothetical protein